MFADSLGRDFADSLVYLAVGKKLEFADSYVGLAVGKPSLCQQPWLSAKRTAAELTALFLRRQTTWLSAKGHRLRPNSCRQSPVCRHDFFRQGFADRNREILSANCSPTVKGASPIAFSCRQTREFL